MTEQEHHVEPQGSESDRLLGCGEAAAYLGVSIGALRHWRRRGLLRHVRVSPRIIRFRRRDLDEFVQARTVEPEVEVDCA